MALRPRRPAAAVIDLVVVSYRTPDDLESFLRSYVDVEDEVASTLTICNVDPTSADLITTEVGNVINFAGNVGYARACNWGAMEGNGEIIGLFNADTRLKPGVLAAVDRAFEDPTVGIVGPKQVDDDGRITHAGIFGSNEQPKLRGWREHGAGRYTDIADAVSVSGSAYFVRRRVWDELTNCPTYRLAAPDALGAFLPTQHYYEETFCSYHARSHGHRVVYLGTAEMIHRWHKASPVGGFADKLMRESQAYFRDACDLHGIEHD